MAAGQPLVTSATSFTTAGQPLVTAGTDHQLVTSNGITGSTTTLTSSLNPSISGNLVTFTATVTPASPVPTGTVTFFDLVTPISGALTLVAGTVSFSTSTLIVGSHNITATYSGDSNYAGSTSSIVTQMVLSSGPPPPPSQWRAASRGRLWRSGGLVLIGCLGLCSLLAIMLA